jgi:hypothetical protein
MPQLAMNKAKVIISPKRERRESISPDWQSEVVKLPGVELIGKSPRSLHIQADESALSEVLKQFGADFHIEDSIQHRVLS